MVKKDWLTALRWQRRGGAVGERQASSRGLRGAGCAQVFLVCYLVKTTRVTELCDAYLALCEHCERLDLTGAFFFFFDNGGWMRDISMTYLEI